MKSSWLAADSPQRRGKGALEYDLVSAVTHVGHNSGSGHYIAHVRQPSGKWLRFDDQVGSSSGSHHWVLGGGGEGGCQWRNSKATKVSQQIQSQ